MLAACGGGEDTPDPENLDELRSALKEKRDEAKELDTEIDELQAQIDKLDPPKEDVALVSIDSLSRTGFTTYIDIQGEIKADDPVNVVAETAGRITRLNFNEDDYVRKGQLVATLDLEQIDKQIDEVNVSLGLARETFQRQKRLWDQNIGSELQYLQTKNQVERLEQTLETLRFQQTKGKVYSPVSGVVEMVPTKQGEVAAPGAPILIVQDLSSVDVVAQVPERYLPKVRRGEQVKVRFPALDRELDARVTQIGRQINPANRTFEVEVRLPNRDGMLKPNLRSIIQIKDVDTDNVVVVPLNLVQEEVSGRKFVYTVGKGNTAQKTYITLGDTYEGDGIITSGLTGSEVIITDGALGLTEGQKLKVQPSRNGSLTEK